MFLKKRDLLFLIIVAVVFGTFYLISGDIKTARVPFDDHHQQYLDVVRNDGKIAAEKFCGECHKPGGSAPIPTDQNHKAPSRCLICHKWEEHE